MPEELSEVKRVLLERYLRGDVPVADVAVETLERPAHIDAPEPASAGSRIVVTPLQTGGARRPFFYLHVHWIGGAFYCFDLAHALGADQPFYILEPYNYDGLARLPSLEEMAASYIETMRSVQPTGPYLLGGFCGGGLIAFEMARQLRASGETIDFLLLIEPRAGPAPFRLIGPRLARGSLRRLGNVLRISTDTQLDWFLQLRHLYLSARYTSYRKAEGFAFFPGAAFLRRDWIGKFVWVIADYFPDDYAGKATYFWASEKPGHRRPGWGKGAKAKELEVHIIPGTHETCRTDHLRDMAQYLRTCLERAQSV